MYRNILVALDGSECSQRALDEAIRIGARATVRTVFVIDVAALSSYPAQYRVNVREEGARTLEIAYAQVIDAGIKCETELAETRNVTDTIAKCLQRRVVHMPADLVVMGTHGRSGLRRLALGSVAEAFVRRSTCPVLLTRALKSA
ncbi:UspA domain-containing protein [Caballeronia novacaledonica]|uniref:UspA domain-containing protein n=1 Tax=Caballeronia novacaledonica TaxID=1544861 RepID=A0A2U3I5V9_9BURK|nr:universal stress protein [Caballeronia novacaledonica]SPB15546.1 UspA domain-containing protein [Caballeronia novacaledonica]